MQAYAHSVGPLLSPIYTLIANLTFAKPTKGAYSTVFAAASPLPRKDSAKYKGAFLKNPGTHSSANPVGEKEELRVELWETTEKVLKDLGLEFEAV